MVAQVVFDEGADEVVAVVIARVAAQREGLTGFGASGLEQVGVQLFGQECVGQALVHQDAVGKQRVLALRPSFGHKTGSDLHTPEFWMAWRCTKRRRCSDSSGYSIGVRPDDRPA